MRLPVLETGNFGTRLSRVLLRTFSLENVGTGAELPTALRSCAPRFGRDGALDHRGDLRLVCHVADDASTGPLTAEVSWSVAVRRVLVDVGEHDGGAGRRARSVSVSANPWTGTRESPVLETGAFDTLDPGVRRTHPPSTHWRGVTASARVTGFGDR